MRQSTRARRKRGGALMEMALLMPWVFLLFIGALYYAHSLISVQAAIRPPALCTPSGNAAKADSAGAYTLVVAEQEAHV